MKTVLFVCIENSCRSQMAEAFARMFCPEGVAVYSGGSRPSGKVNDKAIAAMQALGYDMRTHSSKVPPRATVSATSAPTTKGDVMAQRLFRSTMT